MAHQAHNIPWQSLASNLKFIQDNKRYGWRTDLYPKHGPEQGKQLTHFAKGFANILEQFSRTERAKYPEEYRALERDEVIISTATEEKIRNTVRKYKESNHYNFNSGYSLSLTEKTLPYWINYPATVSCGICPGTPESEGGANDSSELLKALLLHGEMDTILNLAAQPNVRLLSRYHFSYNCNDHLGWSEVAATALMAYLCLNVFFLKPETYDPTFKSRPNQSSSSEEEPDYRRASSYQRMLFRCTGSRLCDSFTYPHRQFFGVAQEQYNGWDWNRGYVFGITSLSNMRKRSQYRPHNLQCPVEYLPAQADIYLVMSHLRSAGLPSELALYVLELAEYFPQRKLVVPDDPLHIQNRSELRRYLNYCWQLLVRCDVLAKECGRRFNWEYHINDAIMTLWGHNSPQMARIVLDEDQREMQDDIGGLVCWWKFI